MSETSLRTKNLKLVLEKREQAIAGVEAMSPADKAQLSADWLARLYASAPQDPWVHGFSMVQRDTGIAVGSCGFKGPPAEDGAVEIAYGVDPDHQRKGYATEAAEALVAFAVASGQVRVVRRPHAPRHQRLDTSPDQMRLLLHRRGRRSRRRISVAVGESGQVGRMVAVFGDRPLR
jgi:GNAT superfamily N-acetyltransferase